MPQDHPLSHHLSDEANRRQPSLAKALYKYFFVEDMQSLGGGLPDPTYFPISHASFDIPDPIDPANALSVDLWNKNLSPNGEASTIDLTVAQQYAAGSGFPELQNILTPFVEAIHHPPSQYGVACSSGNTDAVAKLFRLFLNPGENILFDEFVFGPPVENARSMGCGLVPVTLDAEGVNPEALDEMLNNWNETAHGPKPKVFYTVTTGQNPTATVPGPERLKAIYSVGKKHDLIFIEDNPYHYLQLGPYAAKTGSDTKRRDSVAAGGTSNSNLASLESFAGSLSRTLLSLDVDGRVALCESFSKIIFPGSRIGWVVLNPLFQERYERISEAFFAQLLTSPSQSIPNAGGWGMEGFIAWINKLRKAYSSRRDFFLDILNRELPEHLGLVSWVAPEAGMFVWIKVHLEKHPRFVRNKDARPQTNTGDLMEEIFNKLVDNKALLLPARFFAVPHTLPAGFKGTPSLHLKEDISDGSNFFRATFAPNEPTIEKALVRFGQTLKEFFEP